MRLFAVFCILLLYAGSARSEDLLLEKSGGHLIQAWINGVSLQLRVMLDAPGYIILNRAAVRRVRLGNGDKRSVMVIGPVRLKGRRALRPVTINGTTRRLTVNWYDAPVDRSADGIISPGLLPYDRIILRFGNAPAARVLKFKMQLSENDGLHMPVDVGGAYSIAARFSLAEPNTVAAGAGAAMIAERRGGTLSPDAARVGIGFGVARPIRRLKLAEPVRIGELRLWDLFMRIDDFLGDHAVPVIDSPDGEIIVTATGQRQEALYRMTVGTDAMGACEEAEYQRESRELMLRCR